MGNSGNDFAIARRSFDRIRCNQNGVRLNCPKPGSSNARYAFCRNTAPNSGESIIPSRISSLASALVISPMKSAGAGSSDCGNRNIMPSSETCTSGSTFLRLSISREIATDHGPLILPPNGECTTIRKSPIES